MLTLKSRIHDPLLLGASSISSKIPWHRMIDLNQPRLFVNNSELMLVCQAMVSSSQFQNCLVILIQESGMTMSMPVSSIMAPLKRVQDFLTLVSSGLKVCGPDGEICEATPNKITSVSEDIRSCLERAVAGTFRESGEWSYKEEALFNIACSGNGYVEGWRSEVRSRFVSPVCCSKGAQPQL